MQENDTAKLTPTEYAYFFFKYLLLFLFITSVVSIFLAYRTCFFSSCESLQEFTRTIKRHDSSFLTYVTEEIAEPHLHSTGKHENSLSIR